jgi:hypothetical protein
LLRRAAIGVRLTPFARDLSSGPFSARIGGILAGRTLAYPARAAAFRLPSDDRLV